MAEEKNSFVLYTDYMHTVCKLSDAKAGKLFKHILRFVNDENPVAPDQIIELVFEPIKQRLKKDLKSWEAEKNWRSKAGKKGMETRWKGNNDKQPITSDNNDKNDITSITVSEDVSVGVNVSVNEKGDERKNVTAPVGHEKPLMEGEIWHGEVCAAMSLESMEVCKKWLSKFIKEQKAKEKFLGRTLKDLKHHFVDWLRIQLEKQINGNNKGSNGKVPDRYNAGKQDYTRTEF